MGRLPQPQTSPVYGSYLVSLLFRLTDIMATPEQPAASYTGSTLENTLGATLTIPKVKEAAQDLLERLNILSPSEWKQAILSFISRWSELLSDMVSEAENGESFENLSPDEKTEFILHTVGLHGSIDDIVLELRQIARYLLEQVVSGETTEFERHLNDITAGLFTQVPNRQILR